MLSPLSKTVIAQSCILYNISKKEDFNGRNIRPLELMELKNNFPLISAIKVAQAKKIQGVS